MEELKKVENVDVLYGKISILIENAKRNVAIKVSSELTILYWNIGKHIKENVLNQQKAEYGKEIIKELSNKLTQKYGRGYSMKNIFRMLKFYEYFNNFEILSTLSTKLSWSHFCELLQIEDEIKRNFYTTICINENWSVRTLRERIGSALYERTAISRKPEETIKNDLQLLTNRTIFKVVE